MERHGNAEIHLGPNHYPDNNDPTLPLWMEHWAVHLTGHGEDFRGEAVRVVDRINGKYIIEGKAQQGEILGENGWHKGKWWIVWSNPRLAAANFALKLHEIEYQPEVATQIAED